MTIETNTETDVDPFEAAFQELSELEEKGKLNEYKGISTESVLSSDTETETKNTAEKAADSPVEVGDDKQEVSTDIDNSQTIESEIISEEKLDPTETLLNKFSEIIDRSNKQEKEPEQKPQTQQEQPLEIYSNEEKEFLNAYGKDWQDVVKGEALIRKQEYHQLLNYVFKEVSTQLKPMLENLQILSERAQLTDIKAEVSDYSDIREKVIEWVDHQPSYLRSAYESVIKQGTVTEIKDLIDRYRKDVGGTTTSSKHLVKTPVKTELSEATKQAAAKLAPVDSKRSTVQVITPDKTDFDSAFELFSKEG